MQLHLRSVALRLSLQNTSTYGYSLMKSPSPSWVVEVSEKSSVEFWKSDLANLLTDRLAG